MSSAVRLPIDWEEKRGAIHDWFAAATGLKTIWSDRARPQPEWPYASLAIISGPSRIGGRDDVIQSEGTIVGSTPGVDEIELCRQGPRTFVVSCQIHVGQVKDQTGTRQEPEPNCDATALMTAAEGALESQATKAVFTQIGLAFVIAQDIQPLNPRVGGQVVSRVQMDVEFATRQRVTERTTFIENASVVGSLTDEGGNTIPTTTDFTDPNP